MHFKTDEEIKKVDDEVLMAEHRSAKEEWKRLNDRCKGLEAEIWRLLEMNEDHIEKKKVEKYMDALMKEGKIRQEKYDEDLLP